MFVILACATAQTPQVAFRYFYDANGQLTRAVDSSGNVIEYDYDANGNPAQIQRYSVQPGALSIFNISPLAGQAGQTITIYGQSFSTTPGNDIVKFNGIVATVLSATATQLVVQVPAGAAGGPITVTIGTTTATFDLNFTLSPVPVITSVTPPYGSLGQRMTLTVQGSNFTPATTFYLPGAGLISNVAVSGSTQATMSLGIVQTIGPGYYVMTADTNGTVSSSTPTAGNSFLVMFPPGDNSANFKFSTFNAAYPSTSDLHIPTGANTAAQKFSTFNSAYPTTSSLNIPTGSNTAAQKFSTFNSAYPTTSSLTIPTGSNAAFQLFSTQNSAVTMSPVPLSIRRDRSRMPLPIPGTTGADGSAAANVLIAGETVEIPIGTPALRLKSLDLEVDGVPLVSSTSGSLDARFTVPYSAQWLDLSAAFHTDDGRESDSAPQRFSVIPDPGRTISGRLLDANGQPMPGARVGWQANGLAAEYYRFSGPLSAIPDLAGLTPERTGYVSDLNYPNPGEVFGKDPMGIGLNPSYAARFHGTLTAEAAGRYGFLLHAHAGARLAIDGRIVAAAEIAAGTDLTAGPHEIEVVYYGDAGASILQLMWTRPGGSQEVVPPSVLQTQALLAWTTVAGAGGRFVLRVPAILDGVSVQSVGTNAGVELDQ